MKCDKTHLLYKSCVMDALLLDVPPVAPVPGADRAPLQNHGGLKITMHSVDNSTLDVCALPQVIAHMSAALTEELVAPYLQQG